MSEVGKRWRTWIVNGLHNYRAGLSAMLSFLYGRMSSFKWAVCCDCDVVESLLWLTDNANFTSAAAAADVDDVDVADVSAEHLIGSGVCFFCFSSISN